MGKIFDFQFMVKIIPSILRGIPYTIGIAVVGFGFGLILGLFGALFRIYRTPVLHRLTGVYVSFIRGTPLVVQILLIYYAFPILLKVINQQFGTNFNVSWIPAVIFMFVAYSLNAGAYLTESIRASILAIDKGQMEAALSVGMSMRQAMVRIVLPQAARISLPIFANFFIGLLKDTSLAFTAAVPEIMGQAKIQAGRASRFFEAYIDAALIYWIICFILERIVARIEKKKKEETGPWKQ
ncbi:MAG: amino acid ABC transporter permease [Clostridia bacterium]|nr:amino acid ABC transporter permease [Clostridia bacterium]MBR3430383.1 amino acid ABC transporter permease [Clostridia bacterium]